MSSSSLARRGCSLLGLLSFSTDLLFTESASLGMFGASRSQPFLSSRRANDRTIGPRLSAKGEDTTKSFSPMTEELRTIEASEEEDTTVEDGSDMEEEDTTTEESSHSMEGQDEKEHDDAPSLNSALFTIEQRVEDRFSSSRLPARYMLVPYKYFQEVMDPQKVQLSARKRMAELKQLFLPDPQANGTQANRMQANQKQWCKEWSPDGDEYRKLLAEIYNLRIVTRAEEEEEADLRAEEEEEDEGEVGVDEEVEDNGLGASPTLSSGDEDLWEREELWMTRAEEEEEDEGDVGVDEEAEDSGARAFSTRSSRDVLRPLMVAMVHLVFPRESNDDASDPSDDMPMRRSGSTIEKLLDIVDSLTSLEQLEEEDKGEHDYAPLLDDLTLLKRVFGGAIRIAFGDQLPTSTLPQGLSATGVYEALAARMIHDVFLGGVGRLGEGDELYLCEGGELYELLRE